MKRSIILTLLSAFFLTSCDEIPKALMELMDKKQEVKEYQRFDEINPALPVPAKLDLGVSSILSMAFLGKESIDYEIVTPGQYNLLENRINVFFEHPGLARSLRLLSYARQINSGHPFRINPFIPYMTLRNENSLLSNQKVGPAAVVHDMFKQKGKYVGAIKMQDYSGQKYQFDVKISTKNLPKSGIMFLFDHSMFSMDDLIRDPDKNILQDVIIHEFTHIWHNEILSAEAKDRHNMGSNSTENGHDTMIVSNPNLAFGEGLAESFEALYGTAASQNLNMSQRERSQFFGRFSGKVSNEIEFLVNRQGYVRRNIYLYNLYDLKKCTLRIVETSSSNEIGNRGMSSDEMVERIMRGENIDVNKVLSQFDWENFSDRFYRNGSRVSTTDLMNNCDKDPWQRLESKEGFIATIIYNLLYSGALVDTSFMSERYGFQPKGAWLIKYVSAAKNWDRHWNKWAKASSIGRNVANDERKAEIEKIFLLGFRNLVMGIKNSDAVTIGNLLRYLLSENSFLDENQKMRVAYQIMKVSKGAFLNQNNDKDKLLINYFESASTLSNNSQRIEQALKEMSDNRELARVVEKLDRTPKIMVSYISRLGGKSKKRVNFNNAYHIDLIDMFGNNSKDIAKLAARLDRGEVFQSENEFLEYAMSIGLGTKARVMLNEARNELTENQKQLVDHYQKNALYNHSFGDQAE